MDRVLNLVCFVALVFGDGSHAAWEHRCDPGSEMFACSVATFIYKPGENHSRLIVPDAVRKVRLLYPNDKVLENRDGIATYDAVLHAALNRPRAIFITAADFPVIEIPVDLEYADFQGDRIEEVIVPVPHDADTEYSLRFLNLAVNMVANIDSLSQLVNLETLNLEYNRIETIGENVFRRMGKLTTLVLAGCGLNRLNLHLLPPSLVMLGIGENGMDKLDLNNARFPALEVLSARNNKLTSLDIGALQVAAPNLKLLQIANNRFCSNVTANLLAALRTAAILHDNFANDYLYGCETGK